MPVYEVSQKGLLKPDGSEYEVGEQFSTKDPLRDRNFLARVKVLSGAAQKAFVTQEQGAEPEKVEAAKPEPEPEKELISQDIDELRELAKEAGVKSPHLFKSPESLQEAIDKALAE